MSRFLPRMSRWRLEREHGADRAEVNRAAELGAAELGAAEVGSARGGSADAPAGAGRRSTVGAGFALLLGGLAGPAAAIAPAAAEEGEATPVRVLALGTSLTAGYGLPREEGFTHQLEQALADAGETGVTILDAGVSGDTTAGGLARLDWALADDPDAVIVELGSNDGLRGVDPASTRENLDRILTRLEAEGLPVLLTGMYAPPNMGDTYADAFNGIFPDLADAYDVLFYPFFLKDVATVAALNQGDGIHPNAEGTAVIVDNLLPYVQDLIAEARAGGAADGTDGGA